MMDSYTKESICAGMLAEAQSVAKYMREIVRPRLDGVLIPTQRENLASGIFFRSLCWMETLARLDRVQDFQAVATGTRFLLEACVDLVLIDHDETGQLSTKMSDWATSAKFEQSKDLVKFYEGRNQAVPEQHEPVKFFYDGHKSSVPLVQAKQWGGKHPPRWTNCSLLSDCQTADGLEPIRIPDGLGMPLAEFHKTEIRRLHWQVHGSGVSILKDAPESWFFLTWALGCNWSSDLAVLISGLTMKVLQFNEAIEDIDLERKRLKGDRLNALFEQLKNEIV